VKFPEKNVYEATQLSLSFKDIRILKSTPWNGYRLPENSLNITVSTLCNVI